MRIGEKGRSEREGFPLWEPPLKGIVLVRIIILSQKPVGKMKIDFSEG
jgi:hypothetical protein